MIPRRRFLAITAAALAVPGGGRAASWQGRALGAEVSITIRGGGALAARAIEATRQIIARTERLFSLYDADSSLNRLNRTGRLDAPDPWFLALVQSADAAHRLTEGRFDPSVQPLWRALATGGDIGAARAAVGWTRVRFDARRITLAPGQALTFNGIAQGFATDRVAEALTGLGLRDVLVNIGEYRGQGGPWQLGLDDPAHGPLGQITLTDGAVATSSPGALAIGDGSHILLPGASPLWSTVSVSARNATLADSLSTGLCLAPRALVERIASQEDVQAIRLVDRAGDLTTL